MINIEDILEQQNTKDVLDVLFDLLEQKTGNRYTAKVQNNKIVLSRNDGKFYVFKSFNNTYLTTDNRWSEDKTKAKLFTLKCNAVNAIENHLVSNYQIHSNFTKSVFVWQYFYNWLKIVRPIEGSYHTHSVHNFPTWQSSLSVSESTLGPEFVVYYKRFCILLEELKTITVRNLADDNKPENN